MTQGPDDNPLADKGTLLSREVFYDGDIIMEQGASGHRAYYIEDGEVEIYVRDNKQKVNIACLGPGEIFGEMALIANVPRSASVQAKGSVTVSVISRDDMYRRLKEYKDPVLKSLLDSLIVRLQEANIRQVAVSQELSVYQKKMIGLFEKMPCGLAVDQQDNFMKEIVPVLDQLSTVLDKHKSAFLMNMKDTQGKAEKES